MYKSLLTCFFILFLVFAAQQTEGAPLSHVGTKLPAKEADVVGDIAGDNSYTIDHWEKGKPVFGYNNKNSGNLRFRLENSEFQSLKISFDSDLKIDLSEEDLINPSSSPVSPYENIPFKSRDSFQIKHTYKTAHHKWQTTTTTFSFSHLKKSYCPNKKDLLSNFQYLGWGMWEYLSKTPYASSNGIEHTIDHRFGLAAFGTHAEVTQFNGDIRYSGPIFSYMPRDQIRPEESVGTSELLFLLDEGMVTGILVLGTGDRLDIINGVVNTEAKGTPFEAELTYNGQEAIGKIRGRFYGPTGEEIGGIFSLFTMDAEDFDEITGVFAATR